MEQPKLRLVGVDDLSNPQVFIIRITDKTITFAEIYRTEISPIDSNYHEVVRRLGCLPEFDLSDKSPDWDPEGKVIPSEWFFDMRKAKYNVRLPYAFPYVRGSEFRDYDRLEFLVWGEFFKFDTEMFIAKGDELSQEELLSIFNLPVH